MIDNQRRGQVQYQLNEIRSVIDRLFEGLRNNESMR
jgi:hypothetical protein